MHVAERGAGESFGEIALVHDVPRTATVTARTSLTLLAMTRTEFLDAIGLHVRSLHAVHTQASEAHAPRGSHREGLTTGNFPIFLLIVDKRVLVS